MASGKLRVLVLYGGDGATTPRNELVTWMVEKKALNAEPHLVAWGTPHSESTVAERVKEEIDRADKAIAIVTKDVRSEYGAPNVLEEIGRWLQAKGGRTLCVIRQGGTQVNSNVAGLVYLSFESRIREVFDDLRDFLAEAPGVAADAKPAPAHVPTSIPRAHASTGDFTITTSPSWVLVAGRPYRRLRVDESGRTVTATFVCDEPADEFAVRQLQQRSEVELVYAHHLAQGVLSSSGITHDAQATGTVVVTIREGYERRGWQQEMSFGGPNGMSADEIAEQRARRLLTGEPKARKNDMHGPETMIRGMSAMPVTESALPRLLASVDRTERLAWELVRLELVRVLLLTNCVERIDRLALKVTTGKLVEIDFRGTRHVNSGGEPFVVEIKQDVDY